VEGDVWAIETEGPLMHDDRWKNCEPVPEEEMLFVGFKYTVCEILREIYKAVDDPDIKMKCRVASGIAKKMAARVTAHEGKHWGKTFYPRNPNKQYKRMSTRADKSQEKGENDNGDPGAG